MCILLLLFLILSIIDPSLPNRSPKLIDYESFAAIISLFIISRGLELSGIFGRIASKIVEHSEVSEFKLLSTIVFLVSLSSALIMNDTAMFVFIPLVLTISRITKISIPKAVTIIALAANIGSALTPIGNPQNIIIWRTYKLSVWKFISSMFPYVSLWIIVLIVFIWIDSRGKSLEVFPMPKIKISRGLLLTSILLLIINVAFVEKGHSLIGLALTVFCMAIISREALLALDIALVAVFALVFVDFKELSSIIASNIELKASGVKIILLSAGLSQLISNVPATVMLTSQNLPWLPLAIGVNLGGTGAVIGSLANFIAIRMSGVDLKNFHRYSLPYFLATVSLTFFIFGH